MGARRSHRRGRGGAAGPGDARHPRAVGPYHHAVPVPARLAQPPHARCRGQPRAAGEVPGALRPGEGQRLGHGDLRARCGQRPRGHDDPGRARRRRLGDQRPQDLDPAAPPSPTSPSSWPSPTRRTAPEAASRPSSSTGTRRASRSSGRSRCSAGSAPTSCARGPAPARPPGAGRGRPGLRPDAEAADRPPPRDRRPQRSAWRPRALGDDVRPRAPARPCSASRSPTGRPSSGGSPTPRRRST